MSDIDFDELDRAVNSLMKPQSEPEQSSNSQDTANRPAVASPEPAADVGVGAEMNDQPTDHNVEAANTTNIEADSTETTSRPSLATKRRGRFMDVMHPSANMKTKPSAQARPAAPSRQGVALQPVGDSMSASDSPLQSEVAGQSAATTVGAEVSMAAAPQPSYSEDSLDSASLTQPQFDVEPDSAGGQASDSSTANTDWPDPIDTATDADDASPEAVENSQEATAPTSDSGLESADTPSQPQSPVDAASSPFLPDAKVDKRPLGGLPSKDDDVADSATEELASDHTSTESESSINSNLPEELQAALMSLEGDDASSVANPDLENDDAAQSAVSADEEPAKDTPQTTKKPADNTSADPAPETAAKKSPTPQPLASPTTVKRVPQETTTLSTSLPSRTPPATLDADDNDDDVSTSIFNTDEQPLKHQPKHSSGWYTIMVFVGMVVVGVLGAVVFYMMTNNSL